MPLDARVEAKKTTFLVRLNLQPCLTWGGCATAERRFGFFCQEYLPQEPPP